ncbi:MAG: PIN domain-containing protein [Candidatus Woesearchaeota archaeon]
MIEQKTKIILDTNFLLIPGQSSFDIFEEISKLMDEPYEVFIVDKTIDELKGLTKKGKVKDRVSAKIGIELIDYKRIKKIDSAKLESDLVDDMIIEVADKDTIVATIDKNLKRELLQKGYRVIEIVNKGYLRIKKK